MTSAVVALRVEPRNDSFLISWRMLSGRAMHDLGNVLSDQSICIVQMRGPVQECLLDRFFQEES